MTSSPLFPCRVTALSRARELRRKLRGNITAAASLAGREEVTAVTDIKRSAGLLPEGGGSGHTQGGEGRGIPRRLACIACFAPSDTGLHDITHALACIWLCLMPFTPACICAAGARAYLLGDMEDFWALSDLVDLSRGTSSPLTRWLAKAEAETAALSK